MSPHSEVGKEQKSTEYHCLKHFFPRYRESSGKCHLFIFHHPGIQGHSAKQHCCHCPLPAATVRRAHVAIPGIACVNCFTFIKTKSFTLVQDYSLNYRLYLDFTSFLTNVIFPVSEPNPECHVMFSHCGTLILFSVSSQSFLIFFMTLNF